MQRVKWMGTLLKGAILAAFRGWSLSLVAVMTFAISRDAGTNRFKTRTTPFALKSASFGKIYRHLYPAFAARGGGGPNSVPNTRSQNRLVTPKPFS